MKLINKKFFESGFTKKVIWTCVISMMFVLLTNFSNAPSNLFDLKRGSLDEEISLTIVIRAFIPRDIPNSGNLLREVNGNKILSGPLGNCFLTDSRGFSLNENDSYRVQTKFKVLVKDNKVIVTPSSAEDVHMISSSSKVNCQTGEVASVKQASLNISSLGNPIFVDDQVQIIGQASGNNPHLPSPWIDYSFDFIFDVKEKKLSYTITSGAFPALEVNASLNGDSYKKVIWIEASNSPWNLFDMGTGFNTSNHSGFLKF